MVWAVFAMLIVGCDKSPTAGQIQNLPAEIEEDKLMRTAEVLTEKEIQDLDALENSPSEKTASTASYYLSNLGEMSVQEIREFIANSREELEMLNSLEAEKKSQEMADQMDTSMQYWIRWEDQLFGPNDEIKKGYLEIVSLEKSIALDSIVVDRGECNAVYRDGVNPLQYGESMSFFVNCDPRDVTEVIAVLKDGRKIRIPPR